MNIAQRISQFRELKGYNTNKLAKIAGVGQSTLREIEIGKKQPTIPTLRLICNALDITLAEFFAEETPELDPELRRLLDTAREFSPEQLDKLNVFLQAIKGK